MAWLVTGKRLTTVFISLTLLALPVSGLCVAVATPPPPPPITAGTGGDLPLVNDARVTKKHPKSGSGSAVITDEKVRYLPVCPSPFVCPDINGKIPVGATLNCPDTCTVTRTETGIDDFFDDRLTPKTITGPLCPAGYAQIGVYNMQREYQRRNQWYDAPFPLRDMATFLKYSPTKILKRIETNLDYSTNPDWIQWLNIVDNRDADFTSLNPAVNGKNMQDNPSSWCSNHPEDTCECTLTPPKRKYSCGHGQWHQHFQRDRDWMINNEKVILNRPARDEYTIEWYQKNPVLISLAEYNNDLNTSLPAPNRDTYWSKPGVWEPGTIYRMNNPKPATDLGLGIVTKVRQTCSTLWYSSCNRELDYHCGWPSELEVLGEYTIQMYQCRIHHDGFVWTGKYTPASAVCGRLKNNW